MAEILGSRAHLVALLILALALAPSRAVPVGVRNHRPGTADARSDAHDGPVVRWHPEGPFYRYAMSYTDCKIDEDPRGRVMTWFRRLLNAFVQNVGSLVGAGSGFDCGQIVVGALSEGFGRDCGFKSPRNGQTVMVHTSYDLTHWTLVQHNALGGPSAPSWLADDSIIFRPAVLRNPESGLYVLWANRLPRDEPVGESYRRAGFIVGTSANPEGPFSFPDNEADAMPVMAHAGGADFSLMYDPDSQDAYIAYGAWHNFRVDSAWLPDYMRDGRECFSVTFLALVAAIRGKVSKTLRLTHVFIVLTPKKNISAYIIVSLSLYTCTHNYGPARLKKPRPNCDTETRSGDFY